MLHPSPVTHLAPIDTPRRLVRPQCPYVWTFAVSNQSARAEGIVPEEIVSIIVADGAPALHDPRDWFAARVPSVPPVTGPVHVVGADPDDLLTIEVLALEPHDPTGPSPGWVTIAGGTENGPDCVQVVVPACSAVQFPVRRAGGPIFFGPVLADTTDDAFPSRPVAAHVVVRCTVRQVRSH